MNEARFYDILLLVWIGLAPLTFIALMFITAPYGRHARKGWGPLVKARLGWVLMELPALCIVPGFFLFSGRGFGGASIIFAVMWILHYFNRTVIFPLRMDADARPMPLSIAVFGMFFNLVNGYLIGRYLFHLREPYAFNWLADPRFIVGALIFLAGFYINNRSDAILRALRKPGETGYKIPEGGMYRFISCPNYFGEIVEWGGFALATWSLPGLAFFIWSIANLAPRAISHHKWYLEKFEDYPKGRKALVPFIW